MDASLSGVLYMAWMRSLETTHGEATEEVLFVLDR